MCNTTPITFTVPPPPGIEDVQRLFPFPSPITISGLAGTVSDVNVTLKGVTYPRPYDLNVMLVAPDGKNLLVMSDVGGNIALRYSVTNIDLTYDDQAASFAPGPAQLTAGTYKPTNIPEDPNFAEFLPADSFSSTTPPPNPQFTGPTPSSATTLSVFNRSNPNGDWKLYVVDDEPGPPIPGALNGGWCIDITTASAPRARSADFNGDGKTDVSVFRPATGTWYAQGSPAVTWGTMGDIPVPGDYNGDGTTDIAVFRPADNTWYIPGSPAVIWGTTGDIPVPGDYNGDNKTDIAVYRPSTGTWYIQGSPTVTWGVSGDRPLPLPSAIRQPFFP